MRCCGFGHRSLCCDVEAELYQTLLRLADERGVTEMMTGGMGDFDRLFASTVRRIQRVRRVSLILVKPYFSSELNANRRYYEEMFDDVIVPPELLGVYPKVAIHRRNQWMVDACDYVVTCVRRSSGGAYQAMRYAQKKGKWYGNL